MRHFFSFCSGRMAHHAAAAAIAAAAITFLTGCPHHRCQVDATTLSVDPAANGVFEPGETVVVEPTWLYHSVASGAFGCLLSNPCPPTASLLLRGSDFTGPAGAVYTIVDGAANYGDIPLGGSHSCTATGHCYQLFVSAPAQRPAAHWDTTFVESLPGSDPFEWLRPMSGSPQAPDACMVTYHTPKTWTLHIGASFTDVSTANGFYPFIENLFHNQVTAGCGGGAFCPGSSIRRDQMSVFLLRAEHGPGWAPPPCRGVFTDVPCPGLFTDWVEWINTEGVIWSCGPGIFCPSDAVTRRDMARWLLSASQGPNYLPPAATGLFADVPIEDPDAPWIEDLYNRQITAGCSTDPLLYCPDNPNTRAQMAVFIDKSFGLRLY